MTGFRTLQHLEWDALCEALRARIISPCARQRMTSQSGKVVPDVALPRTTSTTAVEAQQDDLEALDSALALVPLASMAALDRVDDVEEPLSQAERGVVLDLETLVLVVDVVEAGLELRTWLRSVEEAATQLSTTAAARPWALRLVERLGELRVPAELSDRLVGIIDRTPPLGLADNASPELARLREAARNARKSLVRRAERIVKSSGIDALSDRFWTEREGRVVLPVRSDAYSRSGAQGTLSGIIHDSSSSGQTLYVEPSELVEDNNALREAGLRVRAEEHRILRSCSTLIGNHAKTLRACVESLVLLDHLQARRRLARDLRAVRFTPVDPGAASDTRPRFVLPEARHPLMALREREQPVVPNSLVLGVGTALVVTGPNAGGKTVALKTLGLLCLMAQAGLPLPTSEPAVVPLVEEIVTDVGDEQSIAANLSTFSAHMRQVMVALQAAGGCGGGALVLLDEVSVGTEPGQGAALAESILLALVEHGATVMVTTHYERLKFLASREPERFANASVGFDLERMEPTFRITIGIPGSSSAIAVARRLGLPEPLLRHAESLLSEEQLGVDALLRQIEAERESLARERESLLQDRQGLEAEQRRFEALQRQELETSVKQEQRAHEAATSALRALERDLTDRRKSLKKQAPEREGPLQITDPDAREHARSARSELQAYQQGRSTASQVRDEAPAFKVGQKVEILRLGSTGEILEIRGEKITVQAGPIKMTVTPTEIALARKGKVRGNKPAFGALPESSPAKHFGSDAEPVRTRIDNVADLRGMRADEALVNLEVFLDRAIGADQDVVIVQHGFGSGQLRKAIRDHLQHLRYVAKFRPGLPQEGSDAVTVVWIKP